MIVFHYVVYLIVRAFFGVVVALPQRTSIAFLYCIARLVLIVQPRYRRIAAVNLEVVFPDKDQAFRDKTYDDSLWAIARLVYDVARMPSIDSKWVAEHIEFPRHQELKAILDQEGPGVIYASGHLGSFELLAQALCMAARPVSFIVRSFGNDFIDTWWNNRREANGNKVIHRCGARKEVIRSLQSGRDVGILFDQNVREDYAVFVEFFSRMAATTRTVGLSAIDARSKIIVISMKHLGNDQYRVFWRLCDFTTLFDDERQSQTDKVITITQVISEIFEEMIYENPGEWFWSHRRWKTVMPGVYENIYDQIKTGSNGSGNGIVNGSAESDSHDIECPRMDIPTSNQSERR